MTVEAFCLEECFLTSAAHCSSITHRKKQTRPLRRWVSVRQPLLMLLRLLRQLLKADCGAQWGAADMWLTGVWSWRERGNQSLGLSHCDQGVAPPLWLDTSDRLITAGHTCPAVKYQGEAREDSDIIYWLNKWTPDSLFQESNEVKEACFLHLSLQNPNTRLLSTTQTMADSSVLIRQYWHRKPYNKCIYCPEKSIQKPVTGKCIVICLCTSFCAPT